MEWLDPLRHLKHRSRELFLSPRTRAARLKIALSYQMRPWRELLPWLVRSREFTNFTYDLTERNVAQLAALVSVVSGVPPAQAMSFCEEIKNDRALAQHLRSLTLEAPAELGLDPEPRYARRIGWYALVRALRPRLVVETGVDKGLGSCVLAAALARNAADGFPGKLYCLDINPAAGYLLREPYTAVAELRFGNSLESLARLEGPIDLFINDSDHSSEHEAREYEAIAAKLSPRAVVIGDNAHVSNALLEFAWRTGRHFLYFKEEPTGHWYAGVGLGVAFPKGGAS